MSTIIMGLCWPLQMQPTPKAVLMSLADQSNDQGSCWPSMAGIAERTCFGRTAVIEAVKWLEGAGYLSIEKAGGRTNRYTLNLGKLRQREIEPVRQTDQSGKRTGPPTEPPPVRQADKPVRQADPNRKEPSVKRKENTPPLVAVTDLVADGLTEQTAVEWLAHRKRKRAPLTPRAWEGIKAEAVKAGWPIEQAIVKAMARGWQSFDADFVAKEPLPEEAHQAKWWERAPGIRQKGIELGVGDWDREAWESGRGGQDWPTYSGRVFRAAGPGPWQKREAAPLGAGLLKAVA